MSLIWTLHVYPQCNKNMWKGNWLNVRDGTGKRVIRGGSWEEMDIGELTKQNRNGDGIWKILREVEGGDKQRSTTDERGMKECIYDAEPGRHRWYRGGGRGGWILGTSELVIFHIFTSCLVGVHPLFRQLKFVSNEPTIPIPQYSDTFTILCLLQA